MADTASSIKVIPFSGKKDDWSVWSIKFLARANRKGYKDMLTGKEAIPKDSEEPEASEPQGVKDEYKRKRGLNETAYEDLILCINGDTPTGRVAFQCVKGSKTSDIEEGDSALAWKRLNDKFAPKTAPTRLNLRNQFNSSFLQTKQDPDEWLTHLEDIRDRMADAKSFMTDEALMEHALNNVTAEYNIAVAWLEKKVGHPTEPLTMEELRAELSLVYERVHAKHKNRNRRNGDEETALFAGGFKGKCNNCGKYGHKARDCRDRNNNNNNNNRNNRNDRKPQGRDNDKKAFSGKCHYCKKDGHMAKDCFKKKRDEKQKNESANTARDKDDEEVGFFVIDRNPHGRKEGDDGWVQCEFIQFNQNETVDEDTGGAGAIDPPNGEKNETADDDTGGAMIIDTGLPEPDEQEAQIHGVSTETHGGAIVIEIHLKNENGDYESTSDDEYTVFEGNSADGNVYIQEIDSDDNECEYNEESENEEDYLDQFEAQDEHLEEYHAIKNWCKHKLNKIFKEIEQDDEFDKMMSVCDESVKSFDFNSDIEDESVDGDMCFIGTEEIEEIERNNGEIVSMDMEFEGPHEHMGGAFCYAAGSGDHSECELNCDYFYLGLQKYYFLYIPNPEGSPPDHPRHRYGYDWYCRTPIHDEEEKEFEKQTKAWRARQIEIIWQMNEEALIEWKRNYSLIRDEEPIQKAKKPRQDLNLTMLDEVEEFGGAAGVKKESKTMFYSENIYIGDSGASCHMVHSDEGMYDVKTIKERITIGNGNYIEAFKIGKKRGMIKLEDGSVMNIVLQNVKYVPDLAPYNLFSITQAISNGWSLGNEGKTILLKNQNKVLKFNKMLKTKSGYVGGAEIFAACRGESRCTGHCTWKTDRYYEVS